MTREEYHQICAQLAREAIAYAEQMSEEDDPTDITCERDHWIEVFLDEHLPDVDVGVLLAVTSHAKVFEANTGWPAPSLEVAAHHAFQADVWDAINQMETP